MGVIWFFGLCLLAYLIGALPLGYWIGLAQGHDLTRSGSGGTGATNSFRSLGLLWGAVVFILDAFKSYGACMWLLPKGSHSDLMLFVGLCAIIGNSRSVILFLNSRGRRWGGKAVATSLGVIVAYNPVIAGIALAVWGVTLALSRRMSPASMLGVYAGCFLVPFMGRSGETLGWLGFGVVILLPLLVAYLHRDNIIRLVQGTEPMLFGKG